MLDPFYKSIRKIAPRPVSDSGLDRLVSLGIVSELTKTLNLFPFPHRYGKKTKYLISVIIRKIGVIRVLA